MNNQLITVPVRDLIFSILGDDKDGLEKREISHQVAMALEQHLRDSTQWKIIYDDEDDRPFRYPILWRYSEWYTSNLRYQKQKAWSEKERIARFILDANVKNTARAIMKSTGMFEKDANAIAYTIVKVGNTDVLKVMGFKKLITTKEEL